MDKRERATQERAEFEAMFLLAGIRVEKIYELENEYWPAAPDYHDVRTPWYLLKTPDGGVRVGWRKRVISIDWSDTPARQVVTEDNVTKDETSVHAWNMWDAVKYLTRLRGVLLEGKRAKDKEATDA